MRVLVAAFAMTQLALAPAARAQSPARADSAPPPASSVFHASDLWIAGGFLAATVAMFPMDRDIARAVRDSQLVANRSLEEAAKVFGFLGSPGPFIVGGAMYVVGRVADKPRMAHLAVHAGEAVFVGLVATGLLKTTLGRARPWVTGGTDPAAFDFPKGFTRDAYQSFPSGHTTTAFAAAAAATVELSRWYPRSTWIVGPVLYGGAALAGLSRMYEDKHWASDVVMGAAIGTFAGIKTVQFAHTREGNRVDRWLLGDGDDARLQLRVLPLPGGGVTLTGSSRW